MPFIWSSLETARGVGVGATGETRRHEPPRSRDPCCAWPAMCHLVLGSDLPPPVEPGLDAVRGSSVAPVALAMTRASHGWWYLRRKDRGPRGGPIRGHSAG